MHRSLPFLRVCVAVTVLVLGTTLARAQQPNPRADPYEFVQGREVASRDVLVRFRTESPAVLQLIAQLIDADQNNPVGRSGWRRFHSASRAVQALLSTLSARPEIAAVEPNGIVHTVVTPNDPQLSLLWGLNNTNHPGADIHALNAWNVSTGSRGVVVGVVDTGLDYMHPDLQANTWSAPSAFSVVIGGRTVSCPAGSHGFNAITFSCDPMDDNNHGTHVAGTIGAAGNNGLGVTGVNWAASIIGLKFLDATGSGTTADAINAIEFAIQAKARFASSGWANVRVLSNSWGSTSISLALSDEIRAAGSSDMLFVAAAGNATTNNDVQPFYPASDSGFNVIAVAATDDSDRLASFSNFGASSVDVGAPGVAILSTIRGGTFGYLSGTSMATPHVSGAAALILSSCSLTTAQLKSTLFNTVDQVPALVGIVATNGRLDVDRAIRSCAAPSPNPDGSATFVRMDAVTQGNWRSVYGGEGFGIVNDTFSYPAYAQVAPSGAQTWTWAGTTADVRALQRTTAGRTAATWYATSFTLDLNLTDGNSHQVALYGVDWEPAGRTEQIEVLDAGTGAVLDSRTLATFSGGQYLVWTLRGHLTLRVTLTGGYSGAVISGLFFDPVGGPSPNPGGSATFVRMDAVTQGNWRNIYGGEGFGIVNDTFSYPAYAQVTASGAQTWTWASTTADVRALQRATTGRIAATWYAPTFTLDLNLIDGVTHQVALYGLDWESSGRVQRIDILDAGTGALLDSRTLTAFVSGQYLVWMLKGHLMVRVTLTGGGNGAVVSGLFFGP